MHFGLLVSHLPRQLPQPFPHSDAGHVPRDTSFALPHPASWIAICWRRLTSRVFAA
ncbi:MAG TPA: hypothetical protein VGG24_19080 [Paraburkholderia sp.]|jgi:hypothetical protein